MEYNQSTPEASLSSSRWTSFKRSVNLNPPSQNPSQVIRALRSIVARAGHLQPVIPMLEIGRHNQVDVAEMLLTQFQQSGLDLERFLARCAFFHDCPPEQHNAMSQLFKTYLTTYSRSIAAPITPKSASSAGLNDNINIALSYLLQINQCAEQYLSHLTHPVLFDVYFVPPSAANDCTSLGGRGLSTSAPQARCHTRSESAMDDLHWLFCSESAKRMLSSSPRRVVLVIVRHHEYHAQHDILYLHAPRLSVDIASPAVLYNSFLLNLISTTTSPHPKALTVSYHLNTASQRMYHFHGGRGSRVVNKQQIIREWPLLFLNSRNAIHHQLSQQFMDPAHGFNDYALISNPTLSTSQFLFSLKYHKTPYNSANRRRLLEFPKDVLRNDVPETREFNEPGKYLYYYLSWTCKMQLIDAQLTHFSLNVVDPAQPANVVIFNSELHEKYSNDTLYVVALPNQFKTGKKKSNKSAPQWRMSAMMTSYEIYRAFAIDAEDLPLGSRALHKEFQAETNGHNIGLAMYPMKHVRHPRNVPTVYSQKFAFERPNWKQYDMNGELKQSVARIQDKYDYLSLIPILNVDTVHSKIACQALIPIRAPDGESYYAVSYEVDENRQGVVTGLYVDVADILNKATLVDAYAYDTFKWVQGDKFVNAEHYKGVNNGDVILPQFNNMDSGDTVCSDTPSSNGLNVNALPVGPNGSPGGNQEVPEVQSWSTIHALQQQLDDALKRERMLWAMFANQSRSNSPPMHVPQMHHLMPTIVTTPPGGMSPVQTLPVPPEIMNTLNSVFSGSTASPPTGMTPLNLKFPMLDSPM